MPERHQPRPLETRQHSAGARGARGAFPRRLRGCERWVAWSVDGYGHSHRSRQWSGHLRGGGGHRRFRSLLRSRLIPASWRGDGGCSLSRWCVVRRLATWMALGSRRLSRGNARGGSHGNCPRQDRCAAPIAMLVRPKTRLQATEVPRFFCYDGGGPAAAADVPVVRRHCGSTSALSRPTFDNGRVGSCRAGTLARSPTPLVGLGLVPNESQRRCPFVPCQRQVTPPGAQDRRGWPAQVQPSLGLSALRIVSAVFMASFAAYASA